MTDLSRLHSALASFDAGPAGSLDLVRRLADVLDAAREVCAAPPPAAPTSPQDAPVASPLPDAGAAPVELTAAPSRGAGGVAGELALAASTFDPSCPACVATHKFGSSPVYDHSCKMR